MKLSLVQHVLGQMSVSTNVCSRQKFETGYTLLPRTVPDYNVIHVSRGHVVWEIDGKRHDLHPGDFVIVPPAVTHRGYSMTRRMTLTSLHVDARLPGGQDVFVLLNPPRQQHAAKNSRLAGYFAGATAEFDREVSEETHLMLRGWSDKKLLLGGCGTCGVEMGLGESCMRGNVEEMVEVIKIKA